MNQYDQLDVARSVNWDPHLAIDVKIFGQTSLSCLRTFSRESDNHI